jgi:hypothetical protein
MEHLKKKNKQNFFLYANEDCYVDLTDFQFIKLDSKDEKGRELIHWRERY